MRSPKHETFSLQMQLHAPADPITLTAHGSHIGICHSWARLSPSPRQFLPWETKPIQMLLKLEELHLEAPSHPLLHPPHPQWKAYTSTHLSSAKLSHHLPVGTFSTNPRLLQIGDIQPLNTTAATLLLVPQQLETAHKHVPLLGKAALLTSSSLLTRVQACPKTSPLPYEYHHTLFPPVTPTQAFANP